MELPSLPGNPVLLWGLKVWTAVLMYVRKQTECATMDGHIHGDRDLMAGAVNSCNFRCLFYVCWTFSGRKLDSVTLDKVSSYSCPTP